MTVWDAKLPEETFARTKIPLPKMPARIRPVFRVKNENVNYLFICLKGCPFYFRFCPSLETNGGTYPSLVSPWSTVPKRRRRVIFTISIAQSIHFSNFLVFNAARISDVAVYPPICIAGTEEGEIFIMDWRSYTETERGAACTASLCVAFHDGPVVDILPSPHIASTVLSIGGRIWAIWKAVDLVKSGA